MSIPELLFQYTSTIKIPLSILIKYKADVIIISLNVTCSLSSWYSWTIAHFCIIYSNYLFIYCAIQNLCVYV